MKHTAVFTFRCDCAESIYKSVAPEEDELMGRSSASVILEDESTLLLKVEAEDIPALRAALNSWLRLINIAKETEEVITDG